MLSHDQREEAFCQLRGSTSTDEDSAPHRRVKVSETFNPKPLNIPHPETRPQKGPLSPVSSEAAAAAPGRGSPDLSEVRVLWGLKGLVGLEGCIRFRVLGFRV